MVLVSDGYILLDNQAKSWMVCRSVSTNKERRRKIANSVVTLLAYEALTLHFAWI